MNRSSISDMFTNENAGAKTTVCLHGTGFAGRALEGHTIARKAPSGASIVSRGELGEMLYRYRYQGEEGLRGKIIDRFQGEIALLFETGVRFDLLVMVPPPTDRPDYAPVVRLVTELSLKTSIPSAQFAVKSVLSVTSAGRAVPRRPDRHFVFSSPETIGLFTGKRVLVIDDIYRSGRSLHAFCEFLTKEGKVKSIEVLVGTIVEK